MILEVAREFKRLSVRPNLPITLEKIEREDEFIQAALYETIAFIGRRDLRIAREALHSIDQMWIDLERAGDIDFIFDK